uniref:Endonuclease V n=1 Tax=Astyanax mexicanus TaxID=7994 RepID=W5L9D3_ASTMX
MGTLLETPEQECLKQCLVEEDTEAWQTDPDFSGLKRVGGVDLSFIKGDEINACAQLVILSYPQLEVQYEVSEMVNLSAPYIAGFLAFREAPPLLQLLQRLEKEQPSLILSLSLPLSLYQSISLTLGQALRSSGSSTKPVYVSVGHRISLATAVRLTLSCCRYRVPEPIRQVNTHAHTHTLLF